MAEEQTSSGSDLITLSSTISSSSSSSSYSSRSLSSTSTSFSSLSSSSSSYSSSSSSSSSSATFPFRQAEKRYKLNKGKRRKLHDSFDDVLDTAEAQSCTAPPICTREVNLTLNTSMWYAEAKGGGASYNSQVDDGERCTMGAKERMQDGLESRLCRVHTFANVDGLTIISGALSVPLQLAIVRKCFTEYGEVGRP